MGRRPDPRWFWSQPEVGRPRLRLRSLGTAGFVLEAAQRRLVLDPFVSRPGVWRTLLRRLRPDEGLLERHVPHADDVLVGHAHYDHVLDAPALCRRTGARLLGSRAVANVGRAAGLPETQIVPLEGGERIASGALVVRGLRSRHGRVWFGRVPLPGDIESPPPWPPRVFDLRHGLVLNWLVEGPGASVLHVDSADWVDEEVAGLRVEVLCLCAIGWTRRPEYVEGLIREVRPRFVLPCHWDVFTRPLEAPVRVLPGCRLGPFLDAIRTAGATPVLLPPLGAFDL